MPTVELRHEIDTDEETYWSKIFFDRKFNEGLFKDYLKFPGYAVLEEKDEGSKVVRKVQVDPPVAGLPGPVKKVVGDRFSYIENGTFDKAAHKYTFTVTPSTMADKTKVNGELWTEKLGDKKVVRRVRMTIEVKVFMVGSMIEDRITEDLKVSYDKGATYTNEWLKKNG
jgi:hypothetical protein